MFIAFNYGDAFRYVWNCINFFQTNGVDKGVQGCPAIEFEFDSCDTCDEAEDTFSPETLAVLVEEFIMEHDNSRVNPQQWKMFRAFNTLHKTVDRVRYNYTNEDVHQYVWSKKWIGF